MKLTKGDLVYPIDLNLSTITLIVSANVGKGSQGSETIFCKWLDEGKQRQDWFLSSDLEKVNIDAERYKRESHLIKLLRQDES